MQLPLISIALCTYNGEKYLREFLDSIITQTYTNIELVVCDDLSSDQTLHILEEYKNKSSFPFCIYRNETNLGFLRNFEKSIGLCNGKYIATADQDDIWRKDKIEILSNKIRDNSLIYSDSELIDCDGKRLNIKMSDFANFVRGNDFRNLVFLNCISGHAMLFDRNLIQYAFPIPANQEYHDWWIAYVSLIVNKIDFVKEILVQYRVHTDNNSKVTETITQHASNQKSQHKKWNRFNKINEELSRAKSLSVLPINNEAQNEFFSEYFRAVENKFKYPLSIYNFLFWGKNYDALYFIEKRTRIKRYKFLVRQLKGLFFKRIYYKINGH